MKSPGVQALRAGVRGLLLISKANRVVSGRGLSGELTLGRRLGTRNPTLTAGWTGVKENERMGGPLGRGTMEGKERCRVLEGEDPPQQRERRSRRAAPEVERMLKKLILGGLNLLCKVGSMSFCKMGLEDRRRRRFTTMIEDGPPSRRRSVRRICVTQDREDLADAG